MDDNLQRRIQRYGWDRAAGDYESLWQAQLAGAQAALLSAAALRPGQRVLDVACGTGLASFAAARVVGAGGRVVGVDLSERMVEVARRHAARAGAACTSFERMDAQRLVLPDAGFDAALCALGLMYMPDPHAALREMRRVVRPRGRIALAVWGERSRCGWAALFGIVDAEVASDVCPLFFQLGQRDALARLCTTAGLQVVAERRLTTSLDYADADAACRAALVGGPVALAWSRFGDDARERVRSRYIEALAPWRHGCGYRVPAEFVVVAADVPG
jgi:ubiquinone/menaquinone biosynthesis C-methylase UbiE